MRHVIVSSLALLVFGMVVVTVFMTTTASAPPPAPAPAPAPPIATGHEGYPYSGTPPSGHEQSVTQNSYPTTQQQMLYSKFVGFYPDYAES